MRSWWRLTNYSRGRKHLLAYKFLGINSHWWLFDFQMLLYLFYTNLMNKFAFQRTLHDSTCLFYLLLIWIVSSLFLRDWIFADNLGFFIVVESLMLLFGILLNFLKFFFKFIKLFLLYWRHFWNPCRLLTLKQLWYNFIRMEI